MSDWKQRCQTLAAGFVQGWIRNERTGKLEPHNGHWADPWLEHRLVQRAEVEGWSRELRMHVRLGVTRKIMEKTIGVKPDVPMPAFREIVRDVADFLPDEDWIAATRDNARRAAEADRFRPAVDHELTEHLVQKFRQDPAQASNLLRAALTRTDRPETRPQLPNLDRETFEEIQHGSPNEGLHMTREAYARQLSRRITGERDE